ncbi:MAG: 6-pyruvoyl tetrahydropterin synthase family protein [Chitinophagales bacterium]
MVYLTRRERFNSAHKLYNPNWDQTKNEEVFGKCSNENWHGHNYHLYVTVKGRPDPQTGFIINVKTLSVIIRERVIEKVDHRNLNLDVDFLQGVIPSTENFAKAIWHELAFLIEEHGCQLHCVKLTETENIYVEYFGEQ